MTKPRTTSGKQRGKPAALAGVLVIQSVAAVFFLGDSMSELWHDPFSRHSLFEAVVVTALLAGLAMGARQLRQTLQTLRTQDAAIATASGALAAVIRAQFTEWDLTPAERDVALLALKGVDTADIATLRGTASGTVRAQLTRIYSKAGVSGRAQFVSWFVEDLLVEDLDPADPDPNSPGASESLAS